MLIKSVIIKSTILCLLLVGCPLAQFYQTVRSPLKYDSLNIKNTSKVINLQDWYRFTTPDISLDYPEKLHRFDIHRYYPQNVMPENFWELDYRSGSYYVPGYVREELNMIMNRPKDSSFMPVFGIAAFLAYTIAEKMVTVENTLRIKPENIINCIDDLHIMEYIWQDSPQTIESLFNYRRIKQKNTMKILAEKINKLVDNKLVKFRKGENSATRYFPGLQINEFIDLLEKTAADTTISPEQRQLITRQLKKLRKRVNW